MTDQEKKDAGFYTQAEIEEYSRQAKEQTKTNSKSEFFTDEELAELESPIGACTPKIEKIYKKSPTMKSDTSSAEVIEKSRKESVVVKDITLPAQKTISVELTELELQSLINLYYDEYIKQYNSATNMFRVEPLVSALKDRENELKELLNKLRRNK
jgi:hypothetical protein